MFKPINVKRAGVAHGLLLPVQCSPDLQIAVNNSTHLTVLDPQLPTLHRCVTIATQNNSKQKGLDASSLYDVNKVFPVEDLGSLGFQIFSKILIEDGESHFNFGRIADPLIIQHQWSPIENATRNCYLGILLSTGELFVLKRETTDPAKYSVKFRTFPCLVDQMSLLQDQLTPEGDVIVTNEQFLQLKINSFAFARNSSGDLVVSLAHENGQVSIHELAEGLPRLASVQTKSTVVKQIWSDEEKGASTLAVVHPDNSIETIKFTKGKTKDPVTLKPASRFLVSQLKFLSGGVLLTADSRAASLFDVGSASLISKQNLPYSSTVVGLHAVENQILLIHESGKMSSVTLAAKKSSASPTPQAWSLFVNRELYKYSILLGNEQSKAPSEIFQQFLSDNIEGNFYVLGALVNPSGCIVVTYDIAPRNTIHHEIRSKLEFNVGFLRLQDLFERPVQSDPQQSPLSSLHSTFIENIESLPILESTQAVADFVKESLEWKNKWSVDVSEHTAPFTEKEDLGESLVVNMRESPEIRQLQRSYLLSLSYLRTLDALPAVEGTQEIKEKLKLEQNQIITTIQAHLGHILITLLTKNPKLSATFTDADKYLLASFFNILGGKYNRDVRIPQNAEFTESSALCTETFAVDLKQAPENDAFQYAHSTSGHSWRRCNLTLMPIISLKNRTDEMEQFVYLGEVNYESQVIPYLLRTLDYCIYTGQRIFDVKIGL